MFGSSTYKTSVHSLTHFAFLIYIKLVLSLFAYHPLLSCIISTRSIDILFFFSSLSCLPTYLSTFPTLPPSLFLLSFVLRYCAQTLFVLVVKLLTLYFLFDSLFISLCPMSFVLCPCSSPADLGYPSIHPSHPSLSLSTIHPFCCCYFVFM